MHTCPGLEVMEQRRLIICFPKLGLPDYQNRPTNTQSSPPGLLGQDSAKPRKAHMKGPNSRTRIPSYMDKASLGPLPATQNLRQPKTRKSVTPKSVQVPVLPVSPYTLDRGESGELGPGCLMHACPDLEVIEQRKLIICFRSQV